MLAEADQHDPGQKQFTTYLSRESERPTYEEVCCRPGVPVVDALLGIRGSPQRRGAMVAWLAPEPVSQAGPVTNLSFSAKFDTPLYPAQALIRISMPIEPNPLGGVEE